MLTSTALVPATITRDPVQSEEHGRKLQAGAVPAALASDLAESATLAGLAASAPRDESLSPTLAVPAHAFVWTSGFPQWHIRPGFGLDAVKLANRGSTTFLPSIGGSEEERVRAALDCALSLFDGDRSDAQDWLETPLPVLGHRRPLDLAATDEGLQQVKDLVGRIEHGIVS